MKILDAVQECSGLVVLIERDVGLRTFARQWVRPPIKGLSLEKAERLIEEAGIKVAEQ